jgi:hypothetical protein
MTTRPDLAEVRAYMRLPVASVSDVDLQRIYDAAVEDESARCTVPADPAAYPPALAMAFMRMIQREVALRNMPLGMLGPDAAEFSPTRVPWLDSQIEYHQRAYRRMVLG